jgi:hypothetical protein
MVASDPRLGRPGPRARHESFCDISLCGRPLQVPWTGRASRAAHCGPGPPRAAPLAGPRAALRAGPTTAPSCRGTLGPAGQPVPIRMYGPAPACAAVGTPHRLPTAPIEGKRCGRARPCAGYRAQSPAQGRARAGPNHPRRGERGPGPIKRRPQPPVPTSKPSSARSRIRASDPSAVAGGGAGGYCLPDPRVGPVRTMLQRIS